MSQLKISEDAQRRSDTQSETNTLISSQLSPTRTKARLSRHGCIFLRFSPSCSTPLRRQRSPCCPWSSPSSLAQSTHQLTDKTLLTTSAQFKPSLYSSLPPQLLHDARDDAPRSTARAHSVLVGHRQQVALLHGKLAVCIARILHVIGHLVVALCLLGKLGLRTLPVSCDKSAQHKSSSRGCLLHSRVAKYTSFSRGGMAAKGRGAGSNARLRNTKSFAASRLGPAKFYNEPFASNGSS